MPQSTVSQPILDLPSASPFFTEDWCVSRVDFLRRQLRQLRDEVGSEHPKYHLARSWFAVAHGAEAHDIALLHVLQKAEPLIRQHYPQEVRALAMNLACQGLHIWFLYEMGDAIAPLLEAYQLMLTQGVAVEADIVKTAEVLADCLAHTEAYDDALAVLYMAQPYLLAAIEQNELAVAQYDEFREQFIEQHVDDFSPGSLAMVAALSGPLAAILG